jgi:hypothetical protein
VFEGQADVKLDLAFDVEPDMVILILRISSGLFRSENPSKSAASGSGLNMRPSVLYADAFLSSFPGREDFPSGIDAAMAESIGEEFRIRGLLVESWICWHLYAKHLVSNWAPISRGHPLDLRYYLQW